MEDGPGSWVRICAARAGAARRRSAVGCGKEPQTNFERPPAPVTVATAVAQDVPVYIDAVGKMVAREVVSIQPQVSGRITKIHFTDGADVKIGDLLFTIDPRPYPGPAQSSRGQSRSSRSGAELGQSQLRPSREASAIRARFRDRTTTRRKMRWKALRRRSSKTARRWRARA